MTTDLPDNNPTTPERNRLHPALYMAIVLALVGNVYLLFAAHDLAKSVTQLRSSKAASTE